MKYHYVCQECDSELIISDTKIIPECCGKKMRLEPLPYCTSTSHPEMIRDDVIEEPCDDGRGWK